MKLPKLRKAFADKLKIGFHKADVEGDVAADVTEVLNDLAAANRAKRISSQGKGFSDRFRIPLSDDVGNRYNQHDLLVAVNPNSPADTCWHMTLDYNPSRLDEHGQERLRDLVKEIFGTAAQRLLMNACVMEVHTSVDFPIHISEVAIEVEEKHSSGAWGKKFSDGGVLETLYFGSPASDHHVCVYDKRAEFLAAYAKRPDVTLKMVADKVNKKIKRLRMEHRQRASRNPVPLHRTADLRQPFAGAHVYSYIEAEFELEDTLHKVVLELAKDRGLQAALKLLSKSERETMRRALARCRVEWWNASVYADAVTTVVKATGLFPESAFDLAERESSYAEKLYVERAQRLSGKKGRADGSWKPFEGLDEEDEEL